MKNVIKLIACLICVALSSQMFGQLKVCDNGSVAIRANSLNNSASQLTVVGNFAQDTITGVVNRVEAPYFEQNVCDSRFAIVTEGETYYVMVDGYWPNPYLDDLVVHYDTVSVGNEIKVVGSVLEMEDGNGENFSVIDIKELVDAEYLYFNSRICWMGFLSQIAYPGPDSVDAYVITNDNGEPLYFVAIDGELQTDYTSWVVNGETINSTSQYIFVGSHEIWTDYYGEPFVVFNLKLAIPYGIVSDNIEGTLSLNNSLQCLSVYDGTDYYYLTIKDAMQHSFINPDLYDENTSVSVGGVETSRYDMFGNMFISFEIAALQSLEDKTLMGILEDAPSPATGSVPMPGMELAFFSGDEFYYLDNERVFIGPYYDIEAVIIGNDTLMNGAELTATFSSTMRIDNGFEPYYCIFISETNNFNGIQELTAEQNENNIVLKWNYPAESTLNQEAMLSWSNGEDFTEMAYTGENDYVAHRYDSLDLMHFDGWIIRQISMIPIVAENTYTVDVWMKNGESYELVCSQEVQNMVCGEWNQVDLEEGVVIDSSKEYLIGYSSVGEGYYTLAGDLEATVPNKNMIMENGEWFVSPMSLHNWMIRATVTAPENCPFNRDATTLKGYNIFREGELVTNIPYAFQTYYVDESYNGNSSVEYCVTAVYEGGESEATCVSVSPLGLLENDKTDLFTVSPNPASGIIHIEGATVAEVQVCNALGQLLKSAQNTNEISVSELPQGIYMLRITDENGAVAARRIVVR